MPFQYKGESLVIGLSILACLEWMVFFIFDKLEVYRLMLLFVLIVSIIFVRV